MLPSDRTCPTCGEPVPAGEGTCPTCGTAVGEGGEAPPGAPSLLPEPESSTVEDFSKDPHDLGPAPAGIPERSLAAELHQRLARVSGWTDAVRPLGVSLPRFPGWAERALGSTPNPEAWAEAVRGFEEIAQQRILEAFERWNARIGARLDRLEGYAVDNRLEREQIAETLRAVREGRIAPALSTFPQVDRLVAIKERHLDQACDDLEQLVAFVADLEGLGVARAGEAAEARAALEADLRAGKLVLLKQQIRALRQEAANRLRERLPSLVRELGDRIASERRETGASNPGARDLARAAREVREGRLEAGARRLHELASTRKASPEGSGAHAPG